MLWTKALGGDGRAATTTQLARNAARPRTCSLHYTEQHLVTGQQERVLSH